VSRFRPAGPMAECMTSCKTPARYDDIGRITNA
jgi:hypothetical protein